MTAKQLLAQLGVELNALNGDGLTARSPIDGATLASLRCDSPATAAQKIADAHAAFLTWRNIPAPKRGELVRLLGEELRAAKTGFRRLIYLTVERVQFVHGRKFKTISGAARVSKV